LGVFPSPPAIAEARYAKAIIADWTKKKGM